VAKRTRKTLFLYFRINMINCGNNNLIQNFNKHLNKNKHLKRLIRLKLNETNKNSQVNSIKNALGKLILIIV